MNWLKTPLIIARAFYIVNPALMGSGEDDMAAVAMLRRI
jgi:hypothetical protein